MMKPGGSGWNDPPQILHQVHSETKSRRNLLNKRVAYLDHSKPNNSNPVLSSSLPPPTDAIVLNKVPSDHLKETSPPLHMFVPEESSSKELNSKCETQSDKGEEIDNTNNEFSEDLEETINFVIKLRELVEVLKDGKNNSAVTDIKKKLDILDEMQQNKNLSQPVLTGMSQLTSHLLNRQYDKAWEIHVSLMCDHVSQVRSWMVGVKRLISEMKKLPTTK